jgi:hypothetical protein
MHPLDSVVHLQQAVQEFPSLLRGQHQDLLESVADLLDLHRHLAWQQSALVQQELLVAVLVFRKYHQEMP